MSTLPTLKFDTSDFSLEDRIDAVADMWRPYMYFKSDPLIAPRFFLRSQLWRLGDISFLHSVSSPTNYVASVVRDDEPLICIRYLTKGRREYFLENELQNQMPDSVHITSSRSRSHWNCFEDEEALALYVPPSRLGILPGQSLRNRIISINQPVGAILRSMLKSLSESLSFSKQEQGKLLSDSICSFLQPILRDVADLEANGVQRLRRNAIQRYIEANLGNHTLDADHLCQEFHVSRASLYRMFKDEEGVNRYITSRRVQQIQAELSESPPRWGLIKSVAEKYGFDDMSQFNRTFRRFAGSSPSRFAGLLSYEFDTVGNRLSSQQGKTLQPGFHSVGSFVSNFAKSASCAS